MKVLKGIDVSKHQGSITWDKVAPNIDFAIIRCGYGNDSKAQDDAKFMINVKECVRLGIPFGVYLYSYANSDTKLTSEIKHTLRLLKGLTVEPFCVYFDMEDACTAKLGKLKLTQYALTFCKAMTDAGFKAGVYANQYWFQTYLDVKTIHDAGYSIWCAKYSTSKPNIAAPYDLWQFSSKERVAGVTGYVDMNYMYNDIRTFAGVTKYNATELAEQIIAGKWGNGDARKINLRTAGYTSEEIKAAQAIVNKKYAEDNTVTKLDAEQLATAIIRGEYGNGDARIIALRKAGYTDKEIKAAQAVVNNRL